VLCVVKLDDGEEGIMLMVGVGINVCVDVAACEELFESSKIGVT
jgi:hypothetical protein